MATKFHYVLRICNEDMISRKHKYFVWPKKGVVKCPDWKPTTECGNGLHGYLNGEGDMSISNTSRNNPNRVFLVIKVEDKNLISLGQKVKFKEGLIVYCGTLKGALDKFMKLGIMPDKNYTINRWGDVVGDKSVVYAKSGSKAVCHSSSSNNHVITDDQGISICMGCYGQAETGKQGRASCLDPRGKVKGGMRAKLLLTNSNGDIFQAIVDGKKIKSNTWYELMNDQFVKC